MLEGRDWHKLDGASSETIEQLKQAFPFALPESYLSLLSYSNGGEGPLAVQPWYVCLYPAHEVIGIQQSGAFGGFFRDFLVIGGNGGGEAIAFDLRSAAPHPVVAFDMSNSDLAESVLRIADSFDAALPLIGVAQ